MREERREKKKTLKTLLTASRQDRQTERGWKSRFGQINCLADGKEEIEELGCHRFLKPLVKINIGHFRAEAHSSLRLLQAEVTWIHKKLVCFDLSDFMVVTLANFSADGRCAPALIYCRGHLSPNLPTAFIFLFALDSFNSALLSQLEDLMAFKYQHLSPDSLTWSGNMVKQPT